MTVGELVRELLLHDQHLPVVCESWDNRSVDKIIIGVGCIILDTEEDNYED